MVGLIPTFTGQFWPVVCQSINLNRVLRTIHTIGVMDVCETQISTFWRHVEDPSQLKSFFTFAYSAFCSGEFGLKSRCRPKTIQIGSFWAPRFMGRESNSENNFSKSVDEVIAKSSTPRFSKHSACILALCSIVSVLSCVTACCWLLTELV